MTAGRSDRVQVAAIALLVVAWGSTFAAVKIGLDDAPPILFAGMRSLLGGGLVAVLAATRSGPPRLRETWPLHGVLALLNVVLFFSLQTLAIMALPSGLAAVLIYLQPILTGILAWPLLGEPLTRRKVTGLLLGFAGIVVVSAGAFSGHASVVGVGYAVCAAVVWALGTVAFKRFSDRVDAWWAVAIGFLAGGLVLTVVGRLFEGAQVHWTGGFVLAWCYASLMGTALAWALWFSLVDSGEASRAAAYIFFVPLMSLVIGAVLLGETLGLSLLIGAALVVLGVYLVNRRTRRRTVDQTGRV